MHLPVLTINDTPCGQIDLPTEIYHLIEPELPDCIVRGDDDAALTPHFLRILLKQVNGDSVTLRTRNVPLLFQILAAELGEDAVQIIRRFDDHNCRAPINCVSSLLSTTKLDQPRARPLMQLSELINIIRHGRIMAGSDQQKFDMATILTAMFPNAPIVFVVANREEVKHVAFELRSRLNERVYRAFGLSAKPLMRITVATYLAFRSAELRDAPFVVLPIWRSGFPRWMRTVIHGPFRDRIYMLMSRHDPLSAADRDELDGRLGPEISCTAAIPRVAHSLYIFGFGGQRKRQRRNDRDQTDHDTDFDKRHLYWQHFRRNQAIASLAQQLSPQPGSNLPLTVLAETLEHAALLSRLLPDFALIDYDHVPNVLPRTSIVTLTAAAGMPAFRPRTLIFAAGGPPSVWTAQLLARSPDPMEILDLSDGFDPLAAKLAEARVAAWRSINCHWRPLPAAVVKSVGQQLRSKR